MPHISDSENIDNVQFDEQAAAADTPAVGYRRLYTKSDGVYHVDSAGTETKLIDSGDVDGAEVATVADDDTTPGVVVVFPIAISGGAAGDDDVTIDVKIRVLDVWAVHTGGAGEANDTIQVKNGANAITDAMDWSGADNTIVRASEIDDAQHEIASAGTLRVTTTDDDAGSDVGAGKVYVLAMIVA